MVVTMLDDGKDPKVVYDSDTQGRISPTTVDQFVKKFR